MIFDSLESIFNILEKINVRRKHIKIESINITDDRSSKEYVKTLGTPNENHYSNLVHNIVTVQNNSGKTQAITSVQLKNVQLTSK